MQTHIFWSSSAHNGDPHFVRLDDSGKPIHPIHEGYMDTALRIYRNPQSFTTRDIRKAINILRNNAMEDRASRLDARLQEMEAN